MKEAPIITKADGTKEVFDQSRLKRSLMRSGAGEYIAEKIATELNDSILQGTSSHEIYSRAFSILRKETRPVAARYALRRALLELGPSGHPFEDFVAHLFKKEGWTVETRKIIAGKCVSHETDIYATHPEEGIHLAAELKYHNDPAYKTDLKVALYVKSRFDDIFACDPRARACPIDRGFLITNTKFTSEAIKYSECAGVELLGWGYPEGDSLFDRMSQAKVYPITALTDLSRAEKRLLIDNRTISVDQILENRKLLDILHLDADRVGDLYAESEGMLSI